MIQTIAEMEELFPDGTPSNCNSDKMLIDAMAGWAEALKRIQFLEKALDGAIWLAKIEQKRYLGVPQDGLCTSLCYEWCEFSDEPELAKYIVEEKK